MTLTATDYAWFPERFSALAEAYCLTLVERVSPVELLDRLDARERRVLTGVDALVEPAYGAWEDGGGDDAFVGVAAVGDWSLVVEPNGLLGVTEAVLTPLSRGRTVVSHFRNVNALNLFFWYVDGDLRLQFEPLFPDSRVGSDPDGLVEVMRRVGFDLDGDDYDRCDEAAFALAAHLTGVRFTADLLASAEYLCGTVRLPGR
ncbi:DUF6461 domain-containing protein [Micromonospora kangleipakensis]|uniref:DUF6461 domain-containing protein n=1 Tax=Micromonospora kangleipakensis TaxID=1077942 RepID=UPI00102A7586|nr:DUF6461 domain-containing protein [Micromonospora kangleipakensis]